MTITKPTPGGSRDTWGVETNAALDQLDAAIAANTTAIGTKVAKGSLVLNVKDYGAVGDGTTDDSVAIDAAIAAAAAATSIVTVLLPYTSSGYRADGITVGTGVTLRGEGGVLLKRIGSSTATFISATGTDVRIEGLTIDSNGLTTTRIIQATTSSARVAIVGCKIIDSGGTASLSGIETRDGLTDILIERNTFDGVDTPIFVNKGPTRCTVRDNKITNWKTRGIYVLGDASTATTDLSIERNHISANVNTGGTRQPIQFIGDDSLKHARVRVNFNTVIGSNKAFTASGDPGTADGISLHRCTDFEVIGNLSRDGGDMGITIAQQCARGTVANNICVNNDVGAIAIGSATTTTLKSVSVTGNVAMNNGQNRNADRTAASRTGFYIYNASDLAVMGNTFGDDQGSPTQQYGVSMWSSTGVKFVGNTWTGLVIGRLSNGGSNTNIEFGPAYPPVFKTADQTVNNSTTRVSDTHLTAPVEALAVYLVEAYLIHNSSTVADINIAWALPSGATMNWVADGPISTAANANTSVTRDSLTAASNRVQGGIAANAISLPQGVLTVSSTAGSITLQWAQNTLEVSDTKMITGSWLRLTRIA